MATTTARSRSMPDIRPSDILVSFTDTGVALTAHGNALSTDAVFSVA
jgi:hypothetical protein